MKNKTVSLFSKVLGFFIFINGLHLYGQTPDFSKMSPKFIFGKTSLRELELAQCEFDSSASAAILYKKNNLYFDYSRGGMRHEIVVRYKILKSSGLQNLDEAIALPKYFELAELTGFVHNLNEEKQIITTKISESKHVTKQKISKKLTKLVISPPDVRVGTVYELKFAIESPYVDMSDVIFSENIPVYWTEAHYTFPSVVGQYKAILKNHVDKSLAYQHTEKTNETRNVRMVSDIQVHVAFQNIPGLPNEPMSYDKDRYACRLAVDVQSINRTRNGFEDIVNYDANFETAEKFLLKDKDFDKLYESYPAVAEVANSGKALFPDTMAVVKHAISWIRDNFQAESGEFWLSESVNLKEVLKKKKINTFTAHYLLFNVLHELGIRNHALVFFREREDGFLSGRTSALSNCNHALVFLPLKNKEMYFNIGNEYYREGVLAPEYDNGNGYFLDGNKKGTFRNIQNLEQYGSVYTLNFTPNPEAEQVNFTGKLTATGYRAGGIRESLAENGEPKFIDKFKENRPELTFANITVNEAKDREKPVELELSGTLKEGVNFSNDRLFLRPSVGVFKEKSPFLEEKRILPVDFQYLTLNMANISIDIPKGYVVESLPKSEKLNLLNGAGKFAYVCEAKGDKIQVSIRLNVNQVYFMPEIYAELKTFFDKMTAKLSEEIVLKKQ